MDGKVKSGHVVLKAGVMRTKQKRWCIFYNKNEDEQILEFYDNVEDAKKNSKHKKTFHLKQVKSIDTVNKSSSKDYYIDIHMKKERLTLCFECEADLEDWSTVLQNYVNVISPDGGSGANMADEDEDRSTFKANMLYETSEDTIIFDVMIEPTPASEKKCLEPDKSYRLLVTMTNIALEDPTREEEPLLYRWMFEYIRSYGTSKSTGLFTITAGRRSETGEGEFSFKVAHPKAVDQAIDLQTQRKFNLKLQQQHSKVEDIETSSENLRTSTSSKRPKSGLPSGNGAEALSRSSLKSAGKTEQFQKELSASIAARQPIDKQKSNKKHEEKEKKEDKEKKEEKDKKDDKKGSGFHLFGKKKDKKMKEQEKESIETKPLQQKQKASFDDHIYDEAVPQIRPVLASGDSCFYSDVQKKPGNWKTHGQRSSEIHVENYGTLAEAAKETRKSGHKQIPLPSSNDDDDDNMYDSLSPKGVEKLPGKAAEEGLYGTSSGRLLEDISPRSEEEETYDDAVSFQSRKPQINYDDEAAEYETVDI
ncbi:uncharacterized protein LOC132552858 [Ylistrum balloti]|uniref:uncharacterized protein LOC132552858 n=1 Tax=Ylistrum balloti TaxID=509963 RepID=UPI002905CA85|nr:uncharacterized protein LOC132552858 [Ylistrum balloti]